MLGWLVIGCGLVAALIVLPFVLGLALGLRYIPNSRVGVVEKIWSRSGSLEHGHLIAMRAEAGLQSRLLRGGIHAGWWPVQYRVHLMPLVSVPQGKIAYVYARDGKPLRPSQTLAHTVECNDFQDAEAFLGHGGQRGRQRAILREGVYAINLALFVVITEMEVYRLDLGDEREAAVLRDWHAELMRKGAFDPIVIGREACDPTDPEDAKKDCIGIVTVHDGPALEAGAIIAPAVATSPTDPHYHDDFQDVEAFLAAGGRCGRQLAVLMEGTYFINRWFATVELIAKTVVPIGHVGVVISYHGAAGHDVSGVGFRHGERVGEGERGVRQQTLGPGKYAFNHYAGRVYLVPTTNFVLHWINGRSESHRYDESLRSIDLVTADAYEPVLPLSVVVHIDYEKAPSVVQRFGDVKKLITQTLDPLLSAYFRDIAHKQTMLQLLHERDVIQAEARAELRARFAEFDIELVDVLIGKPDSRDSDADIEKLLDQLRLRQLSREQVETYEQQRVAADKLRTLRQAEAFAQKQTELTQSEVEIRIVENRGDGELARARKAAEQTVVSAEAEARRDVLLAEAASQQKRLHGEGEQRRVQLVGDAEADVLRNKVAAYGDPRLYALAIVADSLAQSRQPLVPERLFVSGGSGGDGSPGSSQGQGLLGVLLELLVAERAGFAPAVDVDPSGELVREDAEAAADVPVARGSDHA